MKNVISSIHFYKYLKIVFVVNFTCKKYVFRVLIHLYTTDLQLNVAPFHNRYFRAKTIDNVVLNENQ